MKLKKTNFRKKMYKNLVEKLVEKTSAVLIGSFCQNFREFHVFRRLRNRSRIFEFFWVRPAELAFRYAAMLAELLCHSLNLGSIFLIETKIKKIENWKKILKYICKKKLKKMWKIFFKLKKKCEKKLKIEKKF